MVFCCALQASLHCEWFSLPSIFSRISGYLVSGFILSVCLPAMFVSCNFRSKFLNMINFLGLRVMIVMITLI